ncbi:MAG: hypothetical protein DMG22_03270 [Acidobacteria bacterium]|nr:MAG: hypothetical protein DMG22_03270 [Acidobacteriota bacterium]
MIPACGTESLGIAEVELGSPQTPTRDSVPVSEYIRGTFVPLSNLAQGWQLHAAVSLTPAEERTMVREPAQAVPVSIGQRLGALRVLIVPYIACFDTGDVIAFTKPKGETHSAVWLEDPERIHLLLPCRELDAHDTGFEFLASIGELLRPRLRPEEVGRYTALLEEELRAGVRGEIDEEALGAKRSLLGSRLRRHRNPELFERYRDVSLVSTVAEYMHGLWHDVQIRVGPDHLPLPQLRRRMDLLAELFPPNPGFHVFAEELVKEE